MACESDDWDDSGRVGKGYEEACSIYPFRSTPGWSILGNDTEWLELIEIANKDAWTLLTGILERRIV